MELLRDYHAMFWVFFLFFFKTFSLIQYLFIAATFLMYVTGGEKTEQKKKKDRVFLSFFHNCAYNNLGSERQNKSINCPSLFLDPVTDAFWRNQIIFHFFLRRSSFGS